MTTFIQRLQSKAPDFKQSLDKLLAWNEVSDKKVVDAVESIIANVRSHGDQALLQYSQQLDQLSVESMAELEVSQQRIEQAVARVSEEELNALKIAAKRIRFYHEQQVQSSWKIKELNGTVLGQQVNPLDSVGIYVPGGKASYPSSVLMNAIPAKVAGVEQIVMMVPAPKGELSDLVLAAADIAGVDRIFTIGGAQAIAALAYGTQTVPRVDKIVGPGNIFVATAKRMVFGQVGLDMIAGPSEILVICDGKTPADWIAMDLFSQAEHDENAQSILISDDAAYLDEVEQAMQRLLPTQPRKAIIQQSLSGRGALIHVADMQEAIELSNRIAPEHLELSVDEPEQYLASIRHAGAIFLGRYTPEALGDYCAGPNHVLPTSGTARFSSPLGVYDFQKRSSIIYCSPEGASELAKTAEILARGESLHAHADSARYRILK